jgi:hypothetical protein
MIHRPEPSACTLGALKEKRQRNGKRTAAHGIPDDPTPANMADLLSRMDPAKLREAVGQTSEKETENGK